MAEVEVTRDGGVLTVTLNRPDVLNALNNAVLAGLADAVAQAQAPDVRAVVLTGAGRGFCVGQDLNELRASNVPVGDFLRSTYNPLVLALRALAKPVLAAINGPAAGAGLSLALACDLRLAAEGAAFVPAFVGIGLVPDASGTFFLPRLLGQARAFEWATSNRRLSAEEALAWGLVTEVVPADALAARTAEVAARYAAAPTAAIGLTKQMLEAAGTSTLAEQLELEALQQEAAMRTADYEEGVAAFLEKRPARFTGA